MTEPRRACCTLIVALAVAWPAVHAWSAQRDEGGDRKPSVALRATPSFGFSPLRVRVTVDVRGGADDYADFYCPSIEWEWGDGTMSESTVDCDPYEAGKSSIQRRWSAEHIYRQSGTFRAVFRLKQKDRVITANSVNVQVRSALRDEF